MLTDLFDQTYMFINVYNYNNAQVSLDLSREASPGKDKEVYYE